MGSILPHFRQRDRPVFSSRNRDGCGDFDIEQGICWRVAGLAAALYGIEKGGGLSDERRRLVRKSAHLGTAAVKNGNGILAGLSALG